MAEGSEIITGLVLDALPRRKGVRAAWKEFQEFVAVSREQGELLPVGMAAKLIGVTQTRIGQLVSDGALRTWDFFGRRWLSGIELAAFVKLERPSGIPTPKPSAAELLRMSLEEGYREVRERRDREKGKK